MFRAGLLLATFAACGFDVRAGGTPDGMPDTPPPDMMIDGPPCTPVEVAAGGEHTCARSLDGTTRCWGRATNGQLGIGFPSAYCNVGGTNYFCSTTPLVVQLPPATALGLGSLHTCATTTSGTYCWGLNTYGAYGDGTSGATSGQLVPRLISQRAGATAIAAGTYHTCSVAAGAVSCSGQNVAGEVGNGTQIGQPTAESVMSGADTIATGAYTTCAVDAQQQVRCWGSNSKAQIDGSLLNKLTPTQVFGMTGVVQATVGRGHVCAVFSDGSAKCAGTNLFGQLGTGSVGTDINSPMTVALTNLAEMSAERNHTCARDQAGGVRCFGELYGATPVTISLPAPARSITSGSAHDCALTTEGEVYCWGQQDFGQLGNGVSSATRNSQPQLVPICQ